MGKFQLDYKGMQQARVQALLKQAKKKAGKKG